MHQQISFVLLLSIDVATLKAAAASASSSLALKRQLWLEMTGQNQAQGARQGSADERTIVDTWRNMCQLVNETCAKMQLLQSVPKKTMQPWFRDRSWSVL
jgi:hypothetical protein